MKYAVVDMRNYEWFIKTYESAEEALAAAERDWNYLTEREKLNCAAFYVAEGELDEDGCFNLDASEVVKLWI